MSYDIAMRGSGSELTPLSGANRMPVAIRRQTERGVALEASRAIVSAARVQGTAFVANVALTQAAMLSAQEAALSAADPIAAARYSGIVEDFVMVARGTIRSMGQ
jgi:hypothetical protein